jgi:hypothetical protein
MNILGWVKNAAEPIFNIIDKAVVNKDAKKQAKKEVKLSLLEHAETLQAELTKRHTLDMMSDSWLSKNIRPLSLIFLTAVFVIITFFDGNVGGFSVNPAYVPLYQTLLVTVYSFYFGGRSIEKGVKMYNQRSHK